MKVERHLLTNFWLHMTHYRQAHFLKFLPCCPAATSMLANQKTETHLYSRTKGINCVAPVRNVITRKKLKACQNPWFPHDCVNHLQQKLPPEIEDFSLFNSSATHTICRPAQQSTHLSHSLLVEPHPLIN
jgi:hypothetical protein